jgi:hypothetical protein
VRQKPMKHMQLPNFNPPWAWQIVITAQTCEISLFPAGFVHVADILVIISVFFIFSTLEDAE